MHGLLYSKSVEKGVMKETSHQCSDRIAECKKCSCFINRTRWTKEEDERLINYINIHGARRWFDIAEATRIRRSYDSCRNRWLNHLRPDIKRGNFTKEEEEKIIKIHNVVGNRWATIARNLPHRSASAIREYWRHVIMNKYARGEVDDDLIDQNMPAVCDRNLSLALNNEEINKAGGTSNQSHQMNIDKELNLDLRLSPPR